VSTEVATGRIYVSSHAARSAPASRGEIIRRIARGTGEVLITIGLVVMLFAVYEVYGKTAIVDAYQAKLERQLTQQWAAPGPAIDGPQTVEPLRGSAIARLYLPILHQHWVVVEGVALSDIAYAPGHYPGTALPGQIGNFSVAGHRIPSIFWNLQEMRKGQLIVVQTRDYWYVYTVTLNEIVTPHSIEVVAPTPDRIGVVPSQAMMTLTTCNPKWNDYQRMAVHAVLTSRTPAVAGPPVTLGS
jgi:LPXTG-site transpeptidase (sortase) family protein